MPTPKERRFLILPGTRIVISRDTLGILHITHLGVTHTTDLDLVKCPWDTFQTIELHAPWPDLPTENRNPDIPNTEEQP